MTGGVTAAFKAAVEPFIGNSKVPRPLSGPDECAEQSRPQHHPARGSGGRIDRHSAEGPGAGLSGLRRRRLCVVDPTHGRAGASDLSEWGSVLPNPAFDYAYSWRTQQGDAALGQDPALQQVFAAHNNGGSTALSSASVQPASAATASSSVKAASPNSEFANSIALLNGNNMGAHLAIGSPDTMQNLTSGLKLAAAAELQPNPAVHS
jgi:hypothetical protein